MGLMRHRIFLVGNLRCRGEEHDEPKHVFLIPRREYFVRKEDNELTDSKKTLCNRFSEDSLLENAETKTRERPRFSLD